MEQPSTPRWRELSGGRPGRPSSGGRRRPVVIGLAVAVLALLGGLIAWFVFMRPYPRPHFLPVVLDEYGPGIPPPRWARADARALADLEWARSGDLFTRQSRARLIEALKGLGKDGAKMPVVMYLSGYVVFNAGAPALLPVDGQIDNPASWLSLEAVFANLAAATDRDKVVLLDLMQPLLVPAHGQISTDVVGRIWPTLTAAINQDSRLSIFCACSPGQLSWTSEELGHSAFGYYLRRGLGGAADGWGSGRSGDAHVSWPELVGYVTHHVDVWTQHNVGVRQTPRLLGKQATFRMLPVEKEAWEPPAALPDKYPAWLRDGWKLRDGWWDAGVHRRAPGLVRKAGEVVLTAERRWRSGVEEKRVSDDLAGELGLLRRKKDELPNPDEGRPTSLAQAVARKPSVARPPAEDSLVKLVDLLARRNEQAEAKPDEMAQKKLKADVADFVKPFKDSPDALAALACEAVAEHTVGRHGLRLLAELLARREIEGYDEVLFIARLAKRATDRPTDWSAPVAKLAMQAVREAARANSARAEALLWVSGPRGKAAQLLEQGNRLLFESNGPWGEPAREAWDDAARAYRQVNAVLAVVEAALRSRDEALVRLPGYVAALEVDDSRDAAWRGATSTARDLRRALRGPLGQPGPARVARLEQLAELTRSLQEGPHSLQNLQRPLSKAALAALIKQRPSGERADARLRQALLATTWPSAEQRVELWTSYREHVRRLNATTPSPPSLPPWEAQQEKARAMLRQRDVDRARRALLVYQLQSLEDLADLDAATKQPAEQANWDKLAEGLKKAADRARSAEGP